MQTKNQNKTSEQNNDLLYPLLENYKGFSDRDDPWYFSDRISYFHSPLMLLDIERGVCMLKDTLNLGEKIIVLGDRDVDGVASSAMMGRFLREHHKSGNVEVYVSDEGDDYGLSGELFEKILNSDASLVIFLDMGSSHGRELTMLTSSGKKVIVLDHHQIPSDDLSSDLCAFINPNRSSLDLEHEGKIATVLLTFKFIAAYILSFKSLYNEIQMIPIPSGSKSLAYRMGCYIENESDINLTSYKVRFIDVTSDPVFRLNEKQLKHLEKNPIRYGWILFAMQLQSYPKILKMLHTYIDLVAVGTITDMMPLIGENRFFVKWGIALALRELGASIHNEGLRALFSLMNISLNRIRSRDISWSIGPVLNAAGRMGKTHLALHLLLEKDQKRAKELALNLIQLNEERKGRTLANEKIVQQIIKDEPDKIDKKVLVFYHKDFLAGVSGILATRLCQKYKKPVVCIHRENSYWRGSIRSDDGFNVLELLSASKEHCIQFGGHTVAGGFSLTEDRLVRFENALYLAAESLPDCTTTEREEAIPLNERDISDSLLDELDYYEPFGTGNSLPLFLLSLSFVDDVTPMQDGKHIKFPLLNAKGYAESVCFGRGEELMSLIRLLRSDKKLYLELRGTLEMNVFRGDKRLQFRVVDFKLSKDNLK